MAIKINRILPGRLAGSGGEKAGGRGAARLEEAISMSAILCHHSYSGRVMHTLSHFTQSSKFVTEFWPSPYPRPMRIDRQGRMTLVIFTFFKYQNIRCVDLFCLPAKNNNSTYLKNIKNNSMEMERHCTYIYSHSP